MSAAHLLEQFYGLPPHAPLLPFEVPPLVAALQVEAAKRGADRAVVALAEQLRKYPTAPKG